MTSASRLHTLSASTFTAPPPVETTRARAVRAALRHEGEVHHAHIVNPMVLQAARELITRDDKGQKTNISATGHPYDVLEDISNDLYALGLSQRATVGILDALARYTIDLGTDFVREARAKPLYARIRVTEKLPDDLPDCDLVQTVMIDGQRKIGDGISTRVMEATIYGTRTSMTNTMSMEQALSSGKKKWLLIYFGSPSSTDIRGLNSIDLTMMNLLQGVGAQLPPDDRRALIAAIQEGKLAPEAKQLIETLAKIEQTLDLNGHLPPQTPEDRAILQALMAEVIAQLGTPDILPLIPPALVAAAEEKIRDTQIETTPAPQPADLIMSAEDGSVVSPANTPAANDPTPAAAAPPATIETLIAQVERLAALPEINDTHRASLVTLIDELKQALNHDQPSVQDAPSGPTNNAAVPPPTIPSDASQTDVPVPVALLAAEILSKQDIGAPIPAPLVPPSPLVTEKLEALSAQLVQIAVNEGVPLPAYELISTILPQVSALQHGPLSSVSTPEPTTFGIAPVEQDTKIVPAPNDPVVVALQTTAALAAASPETDSATIPDPSVARDGTAPSPASAIDMTSAFAKTAPSSPSEGAAISDAEQVNLAAAVIAQQPEGLNAKLDQGSDAPLSASSPTGSEAEKIASPAIAAAAPVSEPIIAKATPVTAQTPVESAPVLIVDAKEVGTIEGAAPTPDIVAPSIKGDTLATANTAPVIESTNGATTALDGFDGKTPSPATRESAPSQDTPANFVEQAVEVAAPASSPETKSETIPAIAKETDHATPSTATPPALDGVMATTAELSDTKSPPSQIYSQTREPQQQEPASPSPSGFSSIDMPKVADTQAQYEDRAEKNPVAPIEPQTPSVSSATTHTESPLASFAHQARVDEPPPAPAPMYAHEDYSAKAAPETFSGFAKAEPADEASKWTPPSLQTIQADDPVYSPPPLVFKEDVTHEPPSLPEINDRRREDDPPPSIQPDTSPVTRSEPAPSTPDVSCTICPATGTANCLCHIFNQAIEQKNTPDASYSSAELAAGPLDKLQGLKGESREYPVIKDDQPIIPEIKPSEPEPITPDVSGTICPVTGAKNCLCHIFNQAIDQQRDPQNTQNTRSFLQDDTPPPAPATPAPIPSSDPKRAMAEEFCRVYQKTGKIGGTCDSMNAAIENRDHQGDALRTTLPADGAEESFDKIQALMKKNRKSIENPGVKSKKQDEFDIF